MPLRSSIPSASDYAYPRRSLTRDQTRGVFGQVMGLVAATIAFLALGAYVGRNMSGGGYFIFFLGAIACIFGLQFATARGREQLAIAFLFGLGLLMGLAVAPVLAVPTPRPTPARSIRRPARRPCSSAGSAPTATPPGATSRRGRARCSGRCWR